MTSDLHDRLNRLAGPAAPPSTDTVTADLARARTALRRRRFGLAGAAAVLVAAGLAVPVLLPDDHAATAPIAAPRPETTSAAPAVVPARLVAYTGIQPAGFTLDRVPEGWEVQGVDAGGLTLAPIGTPDRDPHSFEGKIAIMLQHGGAPSGVKQQPVTVAGKPGVLATMLDNDRPTTLFLPHEQNHLVIQVWETLGWSADDIVAFASGVHVEPGAELTVG